MSETKRCDPACGGGCVTRRDGTVAGKAVFYADGRHWCSPECRDNRRRMNEGEAAGDEAKGLYRKYRVTKVNDPDGKHDGCEFFVLDWAHDKFAIPAARAYADACKDEFPGLAGDLYKLASYYGVRHGGTAAFPHVKREPQCGQTWAFGLNGENVAACTLPVAHGGHHASEPSAPAPAVEGEPPHRFPQNEPVCQPTPGLSTDSAFVNQSAGEPPEMTLEQALVAAASGAELQVREPGREWCESHLGESVEAEPVPYFAGLVNRGLRWRIKPQPAPALTRVRALAEVLFENVQAGQQAERRIVEFGERGVREFGARLLQLIDGPAVDALKRALGQAEREFLGPGDGR